jgi:hypothetical protein
VLFYSQETLLVHKDLVHNGGLNELIIELQSEGMALSLKMNDPLFENFV